MTPRALLTLVLLFVPCAVHAAEPRADRNGDPLPDGAIARFGSARLLHGGIEQLAFSPDGKTLATSGADGIRLWDVTTGKVLPRAHLPEWDHAILTFTPDGGHLIGDADGCRLIDPATGKVRCSWQNGGRTPQSITVSADGKMAAVVWEKGGVTMHNLVRGGQRDDWKISDDEPTEISLSGDGLLLAYYKNKENAEGILLWDTRRGKMLASFFSAEARKVGRLLALCLSRDGKRLATTWGDKLLIWDTASHELVHRFDGEPAEVLAVFLRFTDDGKEIVGVTPYQRMRHWSAATGKVVSEFRLASDASAVSWQTTVSRDGRTLATLGNGGSIRLLGHRIRQGEDRGRALAGVARSGLYQTGRRRHLDDGANAGGGDRLLGRDRWQATAQVHHQRGGERLVAPSAVSRRQALRRREREEGRGAVRRGVRQGAAPVRCAAAKTNRRNSPSAPTARGWSSPIGGRTWRSIPWKPASC